jgi:hypothetical protein
MKHLKEYSEEDLTDLASDLKSVGLSDWMGFFITYKVCGDDAAGANAIAAVASSWEEMAEIVLEDFGIVREFEDYDIDFPSLKSIDSIMEALDDSFGSNMGSSWGALEFAYIEMNPRKLEMSIETADLLLPADVFEMGKRVFTDFDSKIGMLKV